MSSSTAAAPSAESLVVQRPPRMTRKRVARGWSRRALDPDGDTRKRQSITSAARWVAPVGKKESEFGPTCERVLDAAWTSSLVEALRVLNNASRAMNISPHTILVRGGYEARARSRHLREIYAAGDDKMAIVDSSQQYARAIEVAATARVASIPAPPRAARPVAHFVVRDGKLRPRFRRRVPPV